MLVSILLCEIEMQLTLTALNTIGQGHLRRFIKVFTIHGHGEHVGQVT